MDYVTCVLGHESQGTPALTLYTITVLSRDLLIRFGAGLDLGHRSLFRSTSRDLDKTLHGIVTARKLVSPLSAFIQRTNPLVTYPLCEVPQETGKQRQERDEVRVER